MIVVSDTSPVTNLLQIDRLKLLQKLFEEIIIPKCVFEELAHYPDQRLAIERLDWISVEETREVKLVNQLLKTLDQGEAEAIALAVELKADLLLIDERKGRRIADKMGIQKTGILGVLIRAKEKGLIPSVKPELDRLIYETNFRIQPNLYQGVLKLVNE